MCAALLENFRFQIERVAVLRHLRRPSFRVAGFFRLLLCHNSNAIPDFRRTGMIRAVRATIDFAFCFDAVTDDVTLAMRALRREHVNRTFETVEGVLLPFLPNGEGFVVIVSAHVAFRHKFLTSRC